MSGSGPMNVFDIAGRAMSAQLVRLNATASNMANAGNVTGSAAEASGASTFRLHHEPRASASRQEYHYSSTCALLPADEGISGSATS